MQRRELRINLNYLRDDFLRCHALCTEAGEEWSRRSSAGSVVRGVSRCPVYLGCSGFTTIHTTCSHPINRPLPVALKDMFSVYLFETL